MKVLISESQYYRLFETTDLESGETADLVSDKPTELVSTETNNKIQELCTDYPNPSLPYCELLERSKEIGSDEVDILNKSIKNLFKVFSHKISGPLPEIIKLSLNSANTVEYLKTISEFIGEVNITPEEKKQKKQRLKRLNNYTNETELDDILRTIRHDAYDKYEKSFEGEVFNKNRTGLQLEYKCSPSKEKFFDLVNSVVTNEKSEKEIVDNITNCIKNTIDNAKVTKADLINIQPLKLENGEVIFPENSYFEVKKITPTADSYLSEFFSVFKKSEYNEFKPTHLKIYNNIIYGIYDWIRTYGDKFLSDVKKNLAGIILDNYTLIKIEDIDLYWSFLGQRGESEYRLSIRYRIKQDKDAVTGYKCDPKRDILTPIPISPGTRELVGVVKKN
jgi:hypothetical protein